MEDYEKTKAKIRLISELTIGEKSGNEKGWLSIDEVQKNLGVPNDYDEHYVDYT